MQMPAHATGNVVPFRRPQPAASSRPDQKGFMEAVYAAGSLPIPAGDREAKLMASRLQIFGFVVIDEVQADGTARRIRASEAAKAAAVRPWRVSKPCFWGEGVALPDADGSLFTPLS